MKGLPKKSFFHIFVTGLFLKNFPKKLRFCRFSFLRPSKYNFSLIVTDYFPVVLLVLSTNYNATINSEKNFLLFFILQHSLRNITTFTVIWYQDVSINSANGGHFYQNLSILKKTFISDFSSVRKTLFSLRGKF